jgi:hypothetical protein
MDHREIGCEDGSWIELAQDRVQWQLLLLRVWKFCVLLSEILLLSEMDLREIGCGVGMWIELAQDRVQREVWVLTVHKV